MREVWRVSLAGVGLTAVSLALLSIMSAGTVPGVAKAAPTPQTSKREFIQATAQGTSTQMGRIVSVNITIEEYSTADDQKALLEAFEEKGQEGLYNALHKMHSKGRMAVTGTLGYEISYVRQFPQPDGSRKIRLVTNRPLQFGETWGSTRSRDYNLSAAEIILSKVKGKSSGTLLPAITLKLDKETGLELEAFQNPWKLVNIMVRK